MARAKAAPAAAAPMTTKAAKAQAVARVLARRRPPRYTQIPGTGSDVVRMQVDGGSEFLEPEDTGQWVDDRQARCPVGSRVADVLFEVFERVRTGGVAEAVDFAADQLRDPREQFGVFMSIAAAPAGPGGVGTSLVRQWKRRGLQTMPVPSVPRESVDWNAPSQQARTVRYRSEHGHPAGLAV